MRPIAYLSDSKFHKVEREGRWWRPRWRQNISAEWTNVPSLHATPTKAMRAAALARMAARRTRELLPTQHELLDAPAPKKISD